MRDDPGPRAVVVAPVELDLASAPAFRTELDLALGSGAHVVVADMGTTTFCDSSGLKELVRAAVRAQAGGQRLEVHRPSQMFRRTAQILGATALLGLVDE